MKDLRNDEEAYSKFIENNEFMPYFKKVKDELNDRMRKPIDSIGPFIPGLFVLAGYTKIDKNFYPVLEQYLNVCIDRCENYDSAEKVELELWRMMKFLHHLEDLHIEIDGKPIADMLGGTVMSHLLGYFWYDYCDEKENQETAE